MIAWITTWPLLVKLIALSFAGGILIRPAYTIAVWIGALGKAFRKEGFTPDHQKSLDDLFDEAVSSEPVSVEKEMTPELFRLLLRTAYKAKRGVPVHVVAALNPPTVLILNPADYAHAEAIVTFVNTFTPDQVLGLLETIAHDSPRYKTMVRLEAGRHFKDGEGLFNAEDR